MKKIHIVLLIVLILLADQFLKIYIKTHYEYNQSTKVFGSWFQLHFVENPGMAYGMKFGGDFGKLLLTLFRIGAVIFGVFYIKKIIENKYNRGFIICVGLIFAGALGNLIDSCLYGIIFDKGMVPSTNGYDGVASFSSHGYGSFLHGHVVDMLHFPLIHGHFPSWMPFWGGEEFEFFSPIFNLADASISTGVIAVLVFQKKFFPAPVPKATPSEEQVS